MSVRSSPLLSSDFTPTYKYKPPPCIIIAYPSGILRYSTDCNHVEKEVPLELVYNDLSYEMVTIGSSHGWLANLEDGVVCLHDDLYSHKKLDEKLFH